MSRKTQNRGSVWRKWDLHVHTPASYDWDKKCKSTAKEIVGAALESGLSAIAITDHHSIALVDDVKAEGQKQNLLVLPGVELRTDKGNKKIHIIALFSEEVKAKTIYDKILCPLGLSESDINNKGNEQAYCNFEEACRVVHENGGIVFLHAGNKSNSIEQLDSDLRSLLKTDLASQVDIFEVANEKQVKSYRDIVFPFLKREFPCLITSDSLDRSKLKFVDGHSIDGLGKAFSWIKADTTFLGLRQVISEPVGRVFLGTIPPKIVDTRTNPTRYIESLYIGPLATGGSSWFSDEITLNPELNAIIGKKGSGKSALVDIVALCGKSHIEPEHYSFLHPNRFRKGHANAKKYKGEITWMSDEKVDATLDDEVNHLTEPERVKYLPQSFVEAICNEHGVSPLFQREINKVIFSYVPEEKQMQAKTLEELLKKHSDVVDAAIERVRVDVGEKNTLIAALESKKTKDYKQKIQNELTAKRKEYDAVKDPPAVPEPNDKLPKQQQDKIKKIEEALAQLDNDIREAREARRANTAGQSFLTKLVGKIQNLESDIDKIHAAFKDDAKVHGIDLKEIIKLSINEKELDTRSKALKKAEDDLAQKLNEQSEDSRVSYFAKQKELKAQQKAIPGSFTEQHRKYEEYKQQKKEAEISRQKIAGKKGDGTLTTIASLEDELEYIGIKLDSDLTASYEERTRLVRKLAKSLLGKIDLFKQIYQPLIDFVEREKEEQLKTGNMLTFDAGIVFDREAFVEGFLKHVDQGRDGTFQHKDAGTKRLREIANKYNLEDSEHSVQLVDELLQNLRSDMSKATPSANDVARQMKQGVAPKMLYDFIYKLEYVDVRFKIRFNDKDLNENVFSPGEKGALLLIFYLLIDKDKIPLIMDQPEENLDNESVFQLLVPYIKKAKELRQIIIVTHNPNLAVVCDAEQVITAKMDKGKNQIRYVAGSIEDPVTNKKIVDILEGTMPAFKKRDQKYLP